MVRDRARRNTWLSILSGVAIFDRAIRIAVGELDWWQFVSVVIITTFCIKLFAWTHIGNRQTIVGHPVI